MNTRPEADFLIQHADRIVTCAGPAPRCGPAQRDVTSLRDAVVAARNGRIVFVGPDRELAEHVTVLRDALCIDATGCTVAPGFVDPHTHLVYAGDRRDELRDRLAGTSYVDIAARGGGILKTVEASRAASEQELVASALIRLDEMAACGTTTCETKSGYGLTTEAELRQLRAIRTLNTEHAIDIVPTFLGAHEIPVEYRTTPDDYVAVVINEMLPAVAGLSLAEWCDVFCERGAFTVEQSADILLAGTRAGLRPRIHADELAPSGGARVGAQVCARSADHLVFVDEEAATLLAEARVCAVLLPIAALYLKLGKYAPARMLIDHGVPVALGTDLNPGAGLSPSMPFAMTLGCFAMDLTLEEALIASTLNAAWSLDRADSVGSIEAGKLMDAILIRGDLTELVRVGAATIRMVIKRGRVIHSRQ